MANSVDKEFKDLGSYGTEEKAAGVNFYISNPSENFKVEPPVDKETGNYEITYTIYNIISMGTCLNSTEKRMKQMN